MKEKLFYYVCLHWLVLFNLVFFFAFEIQVVFTSEEGKIVGFQPLSRVAVNQWADNPLARELYGGKKLSPGSF